MRCVRRRLVDRRGRPHRGLLVAGESDVIDAQSDGQAGAWEQRVRAGDAAALAHAFTLYRERLRRLVQFRLDRRLCHRLDVDDILQDGFLAASQRLKHFQNNRHLSLFVWLRMIVLQTMTDLHREHLGVQMRDVRREQSLHQHVSSSTSAAMANHLVGTLTSPSLAAQKRELSEKLAQAISAMDAMDQEVLALRHFEELTNSEVAQTLGIQQKAASIRYIRAIRRLKAILSQMQLLDVERGEDDGRE